MHLLLLLLLFSTPALGIKLDPETTIRIGKVDRSIIKKAERLLTSKGTVYLLINSPGGSVIHGQTFLDAMRAAKASGVTIVCVVPRLAASMAFYILTRCSYRYSFHFTKFLFHPARITLGGTYTGKDLAVISKQISILEGDLREKAIRSLRMSDKEFDYHYYNDTLFTTDELNKLSPKWVTIVDKIEGIDWVFE